VSVLYLDDVAALGLDEVPPWACLTCGEPVWPPAVYWQGARGQAFWHGLCAIQLGLHLIGDSREAALAADPEPRWRRRQMAGVRHRLVAEERVA
jgi:hypothetical protein